MERVQKQKNRLRFPSESVFCLRKRFFVGKNAPKIFFESLTGLDEDAIMKLKKEALSIYGLIDDESLDEFISECVAEYCSKKPRKMSRDVVAALLHKGGNENAD